MANSSSIDKRKNKNFVINNRFFLKQYALKNHSIFGQGIIVVNLLLLKTDILEEQDLINYEESIGQQDPSVHQPISYIPKQNFWFKMLSLKIKKKYQIDIQAEDNYQKKFLVIFIKDASIEHFSIYSLKL